jgi:hypothetical protein
VRDVGKTPPALLGRANPSPNPILAIRPPSTATATANEAPLRSSLHPPPAKKNCSLVRWRNPPPSGKVSAAYAADSGGTLTFNAPLYPQGVRSFASLADIDDEIVMEVLQEDEAEFAAHL